jgi:dipeptide transport system permease protein
MLAFVLQRLGMLIPTFLGITLVAFFIGHLLPGDPASAMLGILANDPLLHEALLRQMGLDQPLPVQYWRFLSATLSGDLGYSLVSRQAILTEFLSLFPATLELSFCALAFALLAGLSLGIVAAIRRGSLVDRGAMGLALVGYSMPIYWWGLLAILFFSTGLRDSFPDLALPVSGRIAVEYDLIPMTGFMLIDTLWSGDYRAFRSALSHLVLPSLVLGTFPMAVVARMTRSSMLEVMREDYVRTAQAKGLSPARVIIVHVLRNALVPVVTVVGLLVGALMGGAVLTETIFSWPGIGRWMIEAVWQRDYPILQGGLLLIAASVILVNFLVEIVYGLLNPRIRHS